MSDRGAPIRFIKGEYKYQTGWINKDKPATKCRLYVIVHDEHSEDGLRRTFVKKNSVRPAIISTATTYSQAVIEQCPDVEVQIDQLCAELAMCKIEKDPEGIVAIIIAKMNEAVQTQAGNRRALYRAIEYAEDEMFEATL